GDYFSGLFAGQIAFSFAGYDPSIQVLSLANLARSVRCAVEKSRGGIFNVGPNGAIPLRDAFRVAGVPRIPAPHGLQRLGRGGLGPTGLAHQMDQVEYIRYSFTVSNKKISDELGFFPAKSSAEALLELMPRGPNRWQTAQIAGRAYDPFGMDKDYIAAYGRTL